MVIFLAPVQSVGKAAKHEPADYLPRKGFYHLASSIVPPLRGREPQGSSRPLQPQVSA